MKRLKDVNWNQVFYFHEVAKQTSMTKAAQALGVSLPTVSEQIKKLEEYLEVDLFKRSARRIELTTSGWELFKCSKEMFSAGMRYLDKVSPNSLGGYASRVGVQETISAAVSLDFLYQYDGIFSDFGTVNPQRETCSDSLFQKILRNELDWGITLEPPRNIRLESAEIGSFEVAFCCSPSVYQSTQSKADIIRKLPLARSISDKALNEIIDDHLASLDIFPEEIIESDFREFCLGMAYRSRCVAPIAVMAIESSMWKDMLHMFGLGDPLKIKFYATWAKSSERMVTIKKLRVLLGRLAPN